MLLYFVRHGDPIYDPDSLTPLGKRQAEAVGRRVCMHGIDRIFASSSNRAMQTAQPCCEMAKLSMEICDWANESHAWHQMAPLLPNGDKTWAFHHPKYRKAFLMNEVRAMGRSWYEHPVFADTTLKEGICRIQSAADAFLKELGYAHDLENNNYRILKENNDRVALFAHQGFGLAFLSCVLDVPYPIFSTHFDMSHSDMTVIRFGQSGEGDSETTVPCVLTLANDSHIYAEHLPTRFSNDIFI